MRGKYKVTITREKAGDDLWNVPVWKSVWWKAIWHTILPLFLPSPSSHWYLKWEEDLCGWRLPGKVCNQNCESNYGRSKNQQLLARKVRVFIEADCQVEIKVLDKTQNQKMEHEACGNYWQNARWFDVAKISLTMYYALEVPSMLVTYHLFRNFFSPICLVLFSFFLLL